MKLFHQSMYWVYTITIAISYNVMYNSEYYTQCKIYKRFGSNHISMIILLNLNDFTYIMQTNIPHVVFNDYVRFTDAKCNNLLDGEFTKILYSNENITLNGLYIDFPIVIRNHTNQDKDVSRLMYFTLDHPHNIHMMHRLAILEKSLLDLYSEDRQIQKKVQCSLKQQLTTGSVRVYRETAKYDNKYAIKISGIWETQYKIGITYKVIAL